MQERLFDITSDTYGQTIAIVCFATIILFNGIVFATWWARGVYNRIKDFDKSKCQNHAERINTVETRSADNKESQEKTRDNLHNHLEKHEDFAASLAGIRLLVETMQKSIELLMNGKKPDTSLIQTKSPITLNDAGLVIAERLKVDDMIDRNWTDINAMIEESVHSKNPYDIQQYCVNQAMLYPEKVLKEKDLDAVKIDAYKTGKSLADYMNMIGIMIRDKYFIVHQVNIGDVDKHDPEEA